MPMIELLVCDDSDEARAALRTMLADHEEIAIVGEAVNGDEGVERALELRPDVVLMDLHMPIVDGIDATRRIVKLLPSTRVVAYSGADDSGSVSAMTEAGAAAYCVKGAPLWELERAIAGRSEPLVRLAHGIAKATNRSSIGTIVARELVELTLAGAAAAYIGTAEVGLSLAGCAGAARARRLVSAPGLALRAFESLTSVHAEPDDLRELAQIGLPLLERARRAARLGRPGARLAARDDAARLRSSSPTTSSSRDIAELAASAFASERRLALTHAEARRDALTGLANRRALDERLEAALREAAAVEQELTVVLFDLDDFKRFNDEGGHAAGDAVLAQVARAATRVLRAGEELFRVGGDEFALVVTGGADAGRQVADRVQEALGAQTRGGALPSISAGVATYPHDARRAGGAARGGGRCALRVQARRQVTRFQNPASWRHERRRAGAGRHPSPGRPPRPSTPLRRRRPGPADAAADDLRADRRRGRRGEDGRGRARRDRRTAAGRDRARHRPPRRRRPDALPPAQGRPRRRAGSASSCSPAWPTRLLGRLAARARTRCCGSRSARSSCSPSSSGSPAASRDGPFEPTPAASSDEQLLRYAHRPAAAARDRARPAGAAAPHLRADRRRARRRARVEGLRHRDALPARPAVRGRPRAGDRARPAARRRASSTASSCTTSARSGSPTTCCRSPGRSTTPSCA